MKDEHNNHGLGWDGPDVPIEEDQINSNANMEDNNEISDKQFKGPMHELMYLSREGKLIELYFKHGENLIYYFVTKILANVIGKRKWNSMGRQKLLSVFVTNSDDAFALLVMENNCFKWTDEFENPGICRKLKVKAQWSETADGSRNWSMEGMKRYMELFKALEKHKIQHKDRYKDMCEQIRKMEMERTMQTSKKKKKDQDNDNLLDDMSNDMNRELEQFLME